jgi:hypothetical protein
MKAVRARTRVPHPQSHRSPGPLSVKTNGGVILPDTPEAEALKQAPQILSSAVLADDGFDAALIPKGD